MNLLSAVCRATGHKNNIGLFYYITPSAHIQVHVLIILYEQEPIICEQKKTFSFSSKKMACFSESIKKIQIILALCDVCELILGKNLKILLQNIYLVGFSKNSS